MRNSECVIRNGAAVPHIAARRKTPLSGHVSREYRSAITAAQMPRPL